VNEAMPSSHEAPFLQTFGLHSLMFVSQLDPENPEAQWQV
jgi:hypothetical protein